MQKQSIPRKTFGKYEILGELGRGGMGVVYKAYNTQLKIVVALKVIMRQEKEYLERFFLEITAIAKLNHPNIIRFYEYGQKPLPYFTMEYVEGITLSCLIQNKKVDAGRLVELLIPICEALHYAHCNNIVHRDIKPSNIMISKDQVPKVMDFGLAKSDNASKQLSKTGQILGTIHYMAPEQVAGESNFLSDIYSFGASLYEALAYRTVYQGEIEVNILMQIVESTPIPPRQLNPDISPCLEAICLKCLKKNPQKRYDNFKQLATEFKNFRANRPIIARKYSSWDVVTTFVHKHKIICSSVVVIFAILFCSLLVTLNALNYAQQERMKAEKSRQKIKEEKDKTKTALNKVMKTLSYCLIKYEILQQDKDFATLFVDIFNDVESYGESEDWSLLKGFAAAQSGDTQKSIEYYSLQIKINPRSSLAYYNRGNLYGDLKKYEEALADYNKAIRLDPQYLSAYCNRGRLYISLKKYEEALADYNKAIELDSQFSIAYYNRGNLFLDFKKYEEALADYNKAIQFNPQYLTAYMNRGNTHRDLKKYEEALADYSKAIQLNPQYLNAYCNRGSFYNNVEKYPEALADFSKAIQLNPQYFKTYFNRGSFYNNVEKYPEALADFSKAIQLNPQFSFTYYNRGLVYYNMQEYQKAIEDFTKVLSLSSSVWQAHYLLHLCYKNLNQHKKAQYHLRKSQQEKVE